MSLPPASSPIRDAAPDALRALAPLDEMRGAFETLDAVLGRLEALLPERDAAQIRAIRSEAARFSPRICLIGQVKAGKTALANALIGKPNLLPSDVNPWTSSVTALHLNRPPASGKRAVFHFFDGADWDRLVEGGGRLGAAAGREGADEDAETLASQVAALRARAEDRLGRNYRLLLGQSHAFADFDGDLLRRYVCLGDEDGAPSEGRFAELTRGAELHLDAPAFPAAVTFEDTPGVNDPFLLREEMTLDALGRASLCVLVLSAYQALSTTDLALMRLVRTLRGGELVVFVNRTDELADPGAEVPRIETQIRRTLAEAGAPDATIVFGSARMAAEGEPGSGIARLRRAIADALTLGPVPAALDRFVVRAGDVVARAVFDLGSVRLAPGSQLDRVTEQLDALVGGFEARIAGLERRCAAAIEALQAEIVIPWVESAVCAAGATPETDPLRATLQWEYDRIAGEAHADALDAAAQTTAELRRICGTVLKGALPVPVRDAAAPAFGRPVALARSVGAERAAGWSGRLRDRLSSDARRSARLQGRLKAEFGEILHDVATATVRDDFALLSGAVCEAIVQPIDLLCALAAGTGQDGEALIAGRAGETRDAIAALSADLAQLRPPAWAAAPMMRQAR